METALMKEKDVDKMEKGSNYSEITSLTDDDPIGIEDHSRRKSQQLLVVAPYQEEDSSCWNVAYGLVMKLLVLFAVILVVLLLLRSH